MWRTSRTGIGKVQYGMLLGVVLVTLLVALIALLSGWRVRATREFNVAGRRAGWNVGSDIIGGALVGGSQVESRAHARYT